MKHLTVKSLFFLTPFLLLSGCGGSDNKGTIDNGDPPAKTLTVKPSGVIAFADSKDPFLVIVTSSDAWEITSSDAWIHSDKMTGFKGETALSITVDPNPSETPRFGKLMVGMEETTAEISISQVGAKIPVYVPEGYSLVFSDEFDAPLLQDGKTPMPDASKWWFETGGDGWGNNELQNYVPGLLGNDTVTIIRDNLLTIRALDKGEQVISARMNTKESWTYGYFEARLQVPKGKGTWPAFWMMPKDLKSWPLDGEIDIMEHVGYDPEVVHISIHTEDYNHVIGTQKTFKQRIEGSTTGFHIYAVEWTSDVIRGFIDGKKYFEFENDHKNMKSTWPFNVPFYLKLNLAWGGNWGGTQGVDPSALPADYKIDYIRVYQKPLRKI